MKNRVVITGLGAVTPIGNNVEEYWNSLKEGKCGIDFIKNINTDNLSVKIGAEVKNFNPEAIVGKKEMKRLDRFAHFLIVSADEAVKDSKLDLDSIDKKRFGVYVGSGIGGFQTMESEIEKVTLDSSKRISPFFIPMAIINLGAGNVAIRYGAKGPCTSMVTACASGNNNIGEAFRLIKDGYADVMLCGGGEAPITKMGVGGFASLKALNATEDIKRASIPFDKERNGFVIGEGAGVLVLESLEHAQKRGANILAEVVGYGSTCDAYHITLPHPEGEGAAESMRLALEEGQINPSEVSYINAHGTSTSANDKYETAAIKAVFKDDAYKIPVSSTKSMTGHLLGGAGAIEAVACVKSLMEDFVPPTVGLKVKDEELDLDYVPENGRSHKVNYALSNSLGFGGHNAALLFKKWSNN